MIRITDVIPDKRVNGDQKFTRALVIFYHRKNKLFLYGFKYG